jgi:hypothetical protein
MADEIIKEVWKAKDAIAARHNHDVKRLVEHLRCEEKSSGAHMVDLHARQHSQKDQGTPRN